VAMIVRLFRQERKEIWSHLSILYIQWVIAATQKKLNKNIFKENIFFTCGVATV
jgi:hypothetical protein